MRVSRLSKFRQCLC